MEQSSEIFSVVIQTMYYFMKNKAKDKRHYTRSLRRTHIIIRVSVTARVWGVWSD